MVRSLVIPVILTYSFRIIAELCDPKYPGLRWGCNIDCTVSTGYVCYNSTHTCEPKCGDNQAYPPEPCDGGKGCTNCQIDVGWNCSISADKSSSCYTICGDGLVRSNHWSSFDPFRCFRRKNVILVPSLIDKDVQLNAKSNLAGIVQSQAVLRSVVMD